MSFSKVEEKCGKKKGRIYKISNRIRNDMILHRIIYFRTIFRIISWEITITIAR